MTSKPTYQAAQLVAPKVEEHFNKNIDSARAEGKQHLAHAPTAKIIETLLDACFWASMRREEGYSPKISLAFLPPEQTSQPLMFDHHFPLQHTVLVKLSPGVERPGIHLGVWHVQGELYIWGTTRSIPNLCFVLDVSEPGLLVIKHRRLDGYGKFANVAILIGDQVKIVDEHKSNLPECPSLLSSLLDYSSPLFWNDAMNVLVQLAISMRAHKRGGALLIVPKHNTSWQASIMHPIHYAVTPAFTGLAKMLEQAPEERTHSQWQADLRKEVDNLAGLTAIDGATIITDDYDLLAFGAKIGRPDGKAPVDKIYITEPIVGVASVYVQPSQLGGTRHLSAAQFVQDQRDCSALVASQDGRFTIFTWSAFEQSVQAHRIDTLLL